MATNITAAVALTPSISGHVQSSFVNGNVALTPSIRAALHSSAITGTIAVSILKTQDRSWPYTGQESTWELQTEQFVSAPGLNLTLPMITFQGYGWENPVGVLSLTLPSLQFSGYAADAPIGTLNLFLPSLQASFIAIVNESGSLSVSLPSLRFLGNIIQGAVGTLDITIPKLKWELSGHLSAEGTLSLTIPMLQLKLISLPDAYSTMVMNIRNNALTLYDNYNFNSFCRFNGVNLGATSTGIFNLDSGTTDNETQIDWNFRTSYLDLHQKIKKRLTQAWFSYKSSGEIIVTVMQPNGDSYEYPLSGVDITEAEIRAIFGRGIKSKYVALDVKSVDGSTITLDTMKLQFMKTTKAR